jgi:hypothetical protein
MRIAALIIGLVGSLVMFGIGALWSENYDHLKDLDEMEAMAKSLSKDASGGQSDGMKKALDAAQDARKKAYAGYPMLGLGLLGFIASFFVFKFPKVAGGLLALVGLVPAVIAPLSLVFGWMVLLASLFAFLAKPKVRVPKAVAAATAAIVLGLVAVSGFAQTKNAVVDLSAAGIKATMQAPAGASVENAFGSARVAKLPHFSVDVGTTSMADSLSSAKNDAKTSRYYKASTFHTDAPDLIVWESQAPNGSPAFHFYALLKGGDPLFTCADTRPNIYTRADVEAMVAACRSLKAK